MSKYYRNQNDESKLTSSAVSHIMFSFNCSKFFRVNGNYMEAACAQCFLLNMRQVWYFYQNVPRPQTLYEIIGCQMDAFLMPLPNP